MFEAGEQFNSRRGGSPCCGPIVFLHKVQKVGNQIVGTTSTDDVRTTSTASDRSTETAVRTGAESFSLFRTAAGGQATNQRATVIQQWLDDEMAVRQQVQHQAA